jgi:DNA-binding CsgD family transcriptional regulator
VYFYLQNAAAKLQVYSTRHAVSRASELGLLPALRTSY